MSGYFDQTEKTNNKLFLILFVLYIISFIIPSGIPFIFILFGSLFYGFFSKNQKKSFLFGFLIPLFFCLYSFLIDGIDVAVRIFPFYLLLSLLSGLSGFFAAVDFENPAKNKVCYFISAVLIIIMVILIISGIN
ncbi:hypothetical protein MmiHf6_14970 [Methanimicrococcus hongohii]|uniref:Uncharacterized protein n=1 Tax=Methanimicrococcus hongohii TaxID=3028295 RepID=A0AA96V353_9EURY|nr:hypothetical protein MmiHf6_14970 [Methanimicrococcus sp. Hf6]